MDDEYIHTADRRKGGRERGREMALLKERECESVLGFLRQGPSKYKGPGCIL